MAETPGDVTALLKRLREGDQRASSQLFRSVYGELRSIAAQMMRRERPGHELQATALVNEMYLKLFDGAPPPIEGSQHFYRLAVRAMRFILIDNARKHHAGKREALHITIDDRIPGHSPNPDISAALCLAIRRLSKRDSRAAHVVELHYLLGWESDKIASSLQITRRTVERDLVTARLWLKRELAGSGT